MGLPMDLAFYEVTQTLVPSWEQLENLARRSGPPDALVLVHYFGFPNDLAGADSFCRRVGAILIEDCAHLLPGASALGTLGSFAIFSPWKVLATPMLGVLTGAKEYERFIAAPPLHRAVGATARWYAKRLAQRALIGLQFNWYARASFSTKRLGSSWAAAAHAAVWWYERALATVESVARQRIQNYQYLASKLAGASGKFFLDALPLNVIPYAFPYLLSASVSQGVRKLRQKGIPCSTWPELPQQVKSDPKARVARDFADRLVLLPIHQNVKPRQVHEMAEIVRQTLSHEQRGA